MQSILFDLDGVIIRSMEDHYEGWRKALEEYGRVMEPEELYIMEGVEVRELANQFTRKFNLPFEEAANIIEKKQLYYNQIKNIELYPNLRDVFDWIQEKELKTALVTGEKREKVIDILNGFDLMEYFHVIVTADDVFQKKPSPEPYLRAALQLEVEPQECIAVENAPLGIRSAKNSGMRCIAISTTLHPAFLKQADVVTDNLMEVLDVLKKMY